MLVILIMLMLIMLDANAIKTGHGSSISPPLFQMRKQTAKCMLLQRSKLLSHLT